MRHKPHLPDELIQRLELAQETLRKVGEEMRAARQAPTYVEIGKGQLNQIRQLGDGYNDEL